MFKGATLLAVIPAREGSKGLPGKNVMDCAGRPLIEWTIRAALDSHFLDAVVVSTDAEPIAAIARGVGAAVPFLRPPHLASDDASVVEVLQHAWANVDVGPVRADYVLLLQPTSPLRTATHIDGAIESYFRNRRSDEDTLASVYAVSSKFGWLMTQSDDGCYIRFCLGSSAANPQRQSLPHLYMPNGAILLAKGAALANGLYRDNTLPFVMSAVDSVDIDTLDDLHHAERVLATSLNQDPDA